MPSRRAPTPGLSPSLSRFSWRRWRRRSSWFACSRAAAAWSRRWSWSGCGGSGRSPCWCARRGRSWARLLAVAHLAPFAWALAGALVLGALLAFTSLGSISPLPVALGAVAVPAALLVYARGGTGLPPLPRRWGMAIDALIIVLCLLAIPDLVIFGPDSPFGVFTQSSDPVSPRLLPGAGQRGAPRGGGAGGHGFPVRSGLPVLPGGLVRARADRVRHLRIPRWRPCSRSSSPPPTACCGSRALPGCLLVERWRSG